MAADIPLFRSDALRPLVVSSMQLAVQQLRQQPQAHDCEVGQLLQQKLVGSPAAASRSASACLAWQ